MSTRLAKIPACGLLAAGLFVCAHGQIVQTKDGKYSFRTRYAPGAVISYQTLAGEATPSGALKLPAIESPMVIKVLSNKGGNAVIRITTGPGVFGTTQVFEKTSIDMPMDNRNSSLGTGSLKFPNAPIGIGASWKAMMPLKIASGLPAKLDATYRFLGVKKINGINLAVLSFDMTGPAEGSGLMYIRTSDGTLESTETTVRLTAGPSSTTRVRMSVKRKSSVSAPVGKGSSKRKKN